MNQNNWQTWLNCKIHDKEADINGTMRIKIRGEDRKDSHKNGLEFTAIVNIISSLYK
jgi:hypothetical protein